MRWLSESGKGLQRAVSGWVRRSRPAARGGGLRRAAERERAFRRVAALIAGGAPPSAVFARACAEMAVLVKADHAGMMRYGSGHTVTVVAEWHIDAPFGGRWVLEDETPAAIALRTGRPVCRSTASLTGSVGDWARARGIGCGVACPITVDDAPWGVVTALYRAAEPVPDAEERMREFTRLLACAIAQAQGRADLIDAQARFVNASDAERHRIQRDLHDGPQQRLIALALRLHETEGLVRPAGHLKDRLSELVRGLTEVNDEIREISGGLRPATLVRGGLPASLKSISRRCPMPVELSIRTDRAMSEVDELTIFYVVSEALTNVLKHAHAASAAVDLTTDDGGARLTVTDDGIGGADPSRGSGLSGLTERVRAVGGDFQITSPAGGGTSLMVVLPHTDGRSPSRAPRPYDG